MAQNYECTLKQGDLGEPVRIQILNDSNNKPPILTGATVTFKLLQIDDDSGALVELFEKPAVVENPPSTSGVVRYDWEAGDTDLIGRFMGLFKVVYAPSAVPEHYPREGYIWITIEQAGPNP